MNGTAEQTSGDQGRPKRPKQDIVDKAISFISALLNAGVQVNMPSENVLMRLQGGYFGHQDKQGYQGQG